VSRYTKDGDTADTIWVLESCNEIIFIFWSNLMVFNDDRKGWPVTKVLPDGRSGRAEKFQIEAGWRRKNEISPSLANVRELPFKDGGLLIAPTVVTFAIRSTQVKYL
jgi:hypothetical protein